MNPEFPWENITVQSKNRQQLISRSGSRYAPSSPCESLHLIEESDKPCVFVGKPCDASAVMNLKNSRPQLNEKLALVLTFFCAGVPSTCGTLELIKNMQVKADCLQEVRYRGQGWPGYFQLVLKNDADRKTATYFESWHHLQKFRAPRCHLCPDGLGQVADISCGDAWHKFGNNAPNAGESLILVRTERGKQILQRAVEAGYLKIKKSDASAVIKAQGLINRRAELFGRLLARRLLFLPNPQFSGFELYALWKNINFFKKISGIFGSLRRLLIRGLWHKNPLNVITLKNHSV
jgi:coenzyme F420 hydrogenase subunit beta